MLCCALFCAFVGSALREFFLLVMRFYAPIAIWQLKGAEIMTLKELQNRIERTAGMDLPTAAWLRAGNSPLVVSRELEGGTKLSVYQNGFALYQTEGGSTVFRVDRCGGYIYFGRNEQTELSEDFFENTDWWVRLLIEGEDRLTHNRKVLSEKYEYFYESDPEIFNNICVAESSPQDALMTNELLEKAFSMMTERQRAVVTMYVSVPKDLNRVKTKVLFNLTKRQLICIAIAAAIGIPFYFLTRGALGTSNAATGMVILMLPAFLFAMYEKDGMPLEKVLRNFFRVKILNPGIRPYQTENIYEVLNREETEEQKK